MNKQTYMVEFRSHLHGDHLDEALREAGFDVKSICQIEDPVVITRQRYKELDDQETELMTLEDHGVDNWSGYSDAMAEAYRIIDDHSRNS